MGKKIVDITPPPPPPAGLFRGEFFEKLGQFYQKKGVCLLNVTLRTPYHF